MKKLVAITVILALVLCVVPAFAARGEKGASAKAYEKASDEAIFHRVGDWFATRGKSEEERNAILAERKAKRAAKRIEKEAEKKKKQLEKEAKKKKKQLDKKLKGMKR